MELHEVTAGILERRKELDSVTDQCQRVHDRLRHAEHDANSIEQRASETSRELVKAGNQLLNVELRSKALTDKLDQLNLEIESKTNKLSEVDKQYSETSAKLENVHTELGEKKEQLSDADKKLAEVEQKLMLSLRLEELRQAISMTEKVEHEKTERRLTALKDGEKIIVQRTSQLARTRNELQKQNTEYHELNANIARARKDLSQLEIAVKKKNLEIEDLAARREEERAYHESIIEEAEEKFGEINDARNDVLSALRKHREELRTARESIQGAEEKAQKLEKDCKEKEEQFSKRCQQVISKESLLEKLINEAKEKVTELKNLEEEVGQQRNRKDEVLREIKLIVKECEELQRSKSDIKEEIEELKKRVDSLQSELLSNEQLAADTLTSLEQAQNKLQLTEQQTKELEHKKETILKELSELEKTSTDCRTELNNVRIEKARVQEDLEQQEQKFTETKANYQEFEAELKSLRDELEKRQNDLKIELEKESAAKSALNKDSSKMPKYMRPKRHGAQLPIPIKSRGPEVSKSEDDGARDTKVSGTKVRNTSRYSSAMNTKVRPTLSIQNIEENYVERMEKTENSSDDEELSHEMNVSSDVQTRIIELTTEKNKAREALKNKVLEVKRLKSQIEKEKEFAQSSVNKQAAETNDYRRALEHVKTEFVQYQLRSEREVEHLRTEASEHYHMAQRLAQEVIAFKKESIQEKRHSEDLNGSTQATKETIDAVRNQIKSEIIESLREVEQSREDTLKDMDTLKQAKDDIENQLIQLQQSLSETKEKKKQAEKSGSNGSTQETEKRNKQHKAKTLVHEQSYLKDQLRKQMSRRAEVLEEERKKAGQSLEGLKNKLKQLEQVITRKDSTVQDFRLELAKTRIEKERSDDMEKELDELRRRLQDVESERDMAKTERDHLASLSSHVPTLSTLPRDQFDKRRHVVTPQLNDVRSHDVHDESEEVSRILERTLKNERSYRNKSISKRNETRSRSFKVEKRTPGKEAALRKSDLDIEYRDVEDQIFTTNERLGRNARTRSPYTRSTNGRSKHISMAESANTESLDSNAVKSKNMEDICGNSLKILRDANKRTWESPKQSRNASKLDVGKSLGARMSPSNIQGPRIGRSQGKPSVYGPLASTKKSMETSIEVNDGDMPSEVNSSLQSGSLPMSSIAEDKKTKFLAAVARLKNEKLRELEIGLQHFLKH